VIVNYLVKATRLFDAWSSGPWRRGRKRRLRWRRLADIVMEYPARAIIPAMGEPWAPTSVTRTVFMQAGASAKIRARPST
jgi:hypothetical protein